MNQTLQDIDDILNVLSDDLDHPEMWSLLNKMSQSNERESLVQIKNSLGNSLALAIDDYSIKQIGPLFYLISACLGEEGVELALESIWVKFSQNVQVSGALFFVKSLADPLNPKYQFSGRYCRSPFEQVDVLEKSVHQCCASWLPTSAGNLMTTAWKDVWNSSNAQAVRQSMHDGSYRYCNKILCPEIQGNNLEASDAISETTPYWKSIVDFRATYLPKGPKTVNLSYDKTCNLSCPSCRTEKIAATSEMRIQFDDLQLRNILPMLKEADTAFITGSGDPFASKNFRNVLSRINKKDYPNLKIQLMTNGMLFTPQEWEKFPNLKGQVSLVKVSIDAATGPTHELLRRGSNWEVMLKNMQFIGEIRAKKEIDLFCLVFIVQKKNFLEMGDAVDLAKSVGADRLYFARISNWGTFSSDDFAEKCIFIKEHADHSKFLEMMADSRMHDPIVYAPDLADFL
jgi:sulfatase maturation enzyme AslB (radical SAM superfamily)